ncbi:VOC family protein [Asticcacaulis solisilvae]|uniref:VOC family protein n=1 Tax=Asticcacaulis solisilvae TaxID=1217274 RepID=UPI003FD71FDF
MKFNPYLNFDGKCAEAFAFYAELFGGSITFIQTFGESPMKDDVPADWHGAVMHATLDIAGETLGGSDAPGHMFKTPQGFAVTIALSDVDEAERIFAGLVKDGVESMALQQTFWAKRFGMCTDRFGTPWMVNCE